MGLTLVVQRQALPGGPSGYSPSAKFQARGGCSGLLNLHEHLRAAYGISHADEVLDIGCGAGLTTREAAALTAELLEAPADASGQPISR